MSTRVDKDRVTSSTLLTITLVFGQLLPFATGACDVGCICQPLDNGSHVTCRHLESIPAMFSNDVLRLDIENHTFPNDVVTNVTIPPLQNLRHLVISRCRITNITSLAFVRFGLLQVLELSYNLISDLALGSFDGLNNVRKIFLTGNRLVHLPEGLFRRLDLDFLDLSDNLFTKIPGQSFAGSSVRSLNLNNNSVAFAEEADFYHLRTSLRQLALSYNRCFLRLHNTSISWLNLTQLRVVHSQINDTSFLTSSTLIEVDISGNVLSSGLLWNSLQLSKTEVLYARNLHLASLPVDSLSSLTNAKTLDFSENLLSVVRADTFRSTPQLRHLNLARNKIGRLARDFDRYLQDLETLNLSGNDLRYLYDESLKKMVRLKMLDLSENRLQFISESTFRLASVITRIDENPLHCNCQLLWLHSWLQNENATSSVATCATPFVGSLVSTTDDQLNCSSPSIIPFPEMENVTEGEDLLLTCSATADPLASISWTNDQDSTLMLVTPSVTQDRSATKMSAVLRLRRVNLWNAGRYVCHVTNIAGNTSATLTVNVLRKVTASSTVASSVAIVLTPEKLRNTISLGTLLPTPQNSSFGALPKIGQMSRTEVKESMETSASLNADDTTLVADFTTKPLPETTDFVSTNRQIYVDNSKASHNPQGRSIEPVESFTTQVKFSRNTAADTRSRDLTGGFTNFRGSNLFADVSSTSTIDAKTEALGNFSESSVRAVDSGRFTTDDDSTTPDETRKSRPCSENDLSNVCIGNKGEAKLNPIGFQEFGITEGLPVVGIIVAFVGLVILFGIGIFWWFKKRRRCRQYKVGPSSPRRPPEDLDLRNYSNAEVEPSVDSIAPARTSNLSEI